MRPAFNMDLHSALSHCLSAADNIGVLQFDLAINPEAITRDLERARNHLAKALAELANFEAAMIPAKVAA